MTQKLQNKRYNPAQPNWSRLPEAELDEWGDTSRVRFTLWAFLSLMLTAVVTFIVILFNAFRKRQSKMRRKRARQRLFNRDLRRWHNRRERYEKKERVKLEKQLRRDRQRQEETVRYRLEDKYDQS